MAFWLPIERTFFPIVIWIWIGTWLLEGDFKIKATHTFKDKYKKTIFFLVCLFYLLHIIGLLYSENISKGMSDLQLKIIIILFAVVMAGLNELYKRKPYHILASFLSGTLTISLIALIVGTIKGVEQLSITIQKLHFVHHTYFSLYLNFSVLLCFYFFGKHLFIKPRGIWLIIAVFFGIIIWLVQSRAGIILYSLIIMIWLIYNVQKLKFPIFLSRAIIFVIIGSLIFFISKEKKFEPLFNMASHYAFNQEQTINADKLPVRLKIWNSSIHVIQNNWLTGVGTGDAKKELIKTYQPKGYIHCFKYRYNSHNQFLESMIQLGILGLFTLLFLILTPLYQSIKEKNYLLLGFLILIIGYAFIESMLSRLAGVAFFAIIYNYLVFNDPFLQLKK
jgi:O-antigen ligase